MKLKLSEEGSKIREVKDCIQDIYDAMEAAEEFVSGWTFEEFAEDRKTQFAVISPGNHWGSNKKCPL